MCRVQPESLTDENASLVAEVWIVGENELTNVATAFLGKGVLQVKTREVRELVVGEVQWTFEGLVCLECIGQLLDVLILQHQLLVARVTLIVQLSNLKA